MDPIPSTAELLLAWDRQRPRSLQSELGISDLGGCRRAAGYRLAGTPPSHPSGSVQAVLGTAVDDAVTTVLRAMRAAGKLPADAVINEAVEFGGIPGHPDLFVEPVVRDTKTLGFGSQLDRYRLTGAPMRHRWQVHTYGAALVMAGRKVERVELDYIERGSGATWLWAEPFNVAYVRDAFAWLDVVRSTDLEMLPRDYAPDSVTCGHCPFQGPCWGDAVAGRDERSVLYREDPDAARWVAQLEDARAAIADARKAEAEAKGALDALRPNEDGTETVEVAGVGKRLRFTVTRPERLDGEAVRADYARGGARPPVTSGPQVRLTLVPPPQGEC